MIIVFGALALFSAGMCVFILTVPVSPAPITLETLPSQEDIQLTLVRLGAEIEVDGVIGAQTRKEWDRLYCDKMALELWPKGE